MPCLYESPATDDRQDHSKRASDLGVTDAGGWSMVSRRPVPMQGTGLPASIATFKCSDWGSCSALQALQLQSRLQLPPLDIGTVLCAPSLTGSETRSSPAEAACPEVSLGVSFTRVP